ncbi:glycoside hydrolase family 113 [Nonlabens antarcticus]|uniref:glycoside hydrolase family 113 n=1 Tax=Nonlabens antarcticus TaxID=392714 RepID=UPI0018917050|nr:glycoside hydrolase [Nonlabens antarcticus]
MKLFSGLFFTAILLISCNAQVEKPAIPEMIKGISFVATRDSITPEVVNPIKNYNANYVAVHPYAFMRNLENPSIIHNSDRQWWGERIDGTKHTIDIFHENGLKVMLKPQLWIGRGIYTGTMILPDAARWDTLETTYEKFILDYAQVAQETNADLFCIGTELESFVIARPKYWNALILKIREIYKGKLTYAGNWDSYKVVPFWDQMDYIGIDAYFPVSDQKAPDLMTTKNGWKKWKAELSSLSRKHDKKILFAEYGYVSADYAGKEPWATADETRSVNNKAQQILLQAQYESIWKEDWFAGGFLWKHHAESSRRGYAKRFTPQGKPAEKTVTEAYGKY